MIKQINEDQKFETKKKLNSPRLLFC